MLPTALHFGSDSNPFPVPQRVGWNFHFLITNHGIFVLPLISPYHPQRALSASRISSFIRSSRLSASDSSIRWKQSYLPIQIWADVTPTNQGELYANIQFHRFQVPAPPGSVSSIEFRHKFSFPPAKEHLCRHSSVASFAGFRVRIVSR